jgi:hypothetical protein
MSSRVNVLYLQVEGEAVGAVLDIVRAAMGAPPPILREIAAPAGDPPALLAASAAEDRAEPQTPPRPGARQPKARAPRPVSSVQAAAVVEDSGVAAACVQALSKGPLTTADVALKAAYSYGAVCAALRELRNAKRVESVTDESDGQRKNKLVKGGSGG